MTLTDILAARKGNFGVIAALVLPVLLGAGGLAVDASNMFSAKAALQESLDAATLAASNLANSEAERRAIFERTLDANSRNGGTLLDVEGQIDFDKGANYLSAKSTATAEVKLVFMSAFDKTNPTIRVSAQTYQSTKSLEVAMVLDNTGSLGESGIRAVRDAASGLVDILHNQSETNGKNIKVALVPFVTAVNVKGNDYSDRWIDTKGKAKFNGANFEGHHDHLSLFGKLGVAWKGCVEARPAPFNIGDTPPDEDAPDTLFVPYFAPDEPGPAKTPGNDGARFNNSYLDDQIAGPAPYGDAADQRNRQRSIAKYMSHPDISRITENQSLSNGPNRACPTPIVPLTDKFDELQTAIKGMKYWNGSGTNVSEGMAWGWRVLSPAEPYAEGKPFDSAGNSKAIILFTDGDNVVFGASSEQINKSDYGAYGFLDANRFGTANQGSAARQVDEWTQNVCSSLKERNVEIFAVLLNAESANNRKLYTACVSAPENYYAISKSSELKSVFAKIAAQVTKLYLVN